MLEILIGQLAYIGCFKRPLLAILCHVFRQSSPDGARDSVFQLHPWAKNELTGLGCLLPLAVTHLCTGFGNSLFGADASLEVAGGVKVRVTFTLVQELWRRSPREAGARAFLDPWSAALRSDGVDDVDDGPASDLSDDEDFWGRTDEGDVPKS